MSLLTTGPEVLTSTLIFTILWTLLQIHIQHHGPYPSARHLMRLHNYIQVLLSLMLLATNLACHIPTLAVLSPLQAPLQAESCRVPRMLYHASKFYEYCDILIFVAQGGGVGLHFGFHHLTTPWYTLARVVRDHQGWGVFAAWNGVHHALSKCSELWNFMGCLVKGVDREFCKRGC
jgi:hypothetical protein